jgi:hypothetical protein
LKTKEPFEQSESGVVSIRIENAKKSDSGQYLCYGFPPDRSKYEVKMFKVVVGEEELVRGTGHQEKSAVVNGTIELECELSSQNSPDNKLKWNKLNGVSV